MRQRAVRLKKYVFDVTEGYPLCDTETVIWYTETAACFAILHLFAPKIVPNIAFSAVFRVASRPYNFRPCVKYVSRNILKRPVLVVAVMPFEKAPDLQDLRGDSRWRLRARGRAKSRGLVENTSTRF